ncbi:hypothetical protein CYY_003265 [Polysphondylium violaceum]|uniref:Gelsolin-like domain-containing protein n=1 Tax=Polysphondylium violaceum TaxID=133409 RepID=A0A8J4UUF9_9MYCE|nr:hypothetical protein CYY_003265 [Polysphondylium violaceum]
MEPKRTISKSKEGGSKSSKPPQHPNSKQQHSNRKTNRTNKKKNNNSNNNNNNNNSKKKTFTIEENLLAGTEGKKEEEELSQNEKDLLNKNVLDIKKKKQETDHAHRKEKQKKQEKKKLITETLKKKDELAKLQRKEEEEKKKQIEKQRLDDEKEIAAKLSELNLTKTIGHIGNGSSTMKGTSNVNHSHSGGKFSTFKRNTSMTEENILNAFKKKGSMTPSDANSLRKVSSHNSLGIKSSSSLFRTISVPRLSKQQISVLDIFQQQQQQQQQNGSASSPTTPGSPSSPRSMSPLLGHFSNSSSSLGKSLAQSGAGSRGSINSDLSNLSESISRYDFLNRPASIHKKPAQESLQRQSLKQDDYYSTQNTSKRWDDYVKTLLPTDQEILKRRKEESEEDSESEEGSISLESQEESEEESEQEESEQESEPESEEVESVDQEDLESEQESVDDESEQESQDEESEDEPIKSPPTESSQQPTTTNHKVEQESSASSKSVIIQKDGSTTPVSPIQENKRLSMTKEKRLSLSGENKRLSINKEHKRLSITKDEKRLSGSGQLTPKKSKEEDEGTKIINALLNKMSTRTFNTNTGDSSYASATQKPPQMVNIFKYGILDIDFSDLFGEEEDLKGFIMWSVHSFGLEEREYDDYNILYNKDSYLVMNLSNDNKNDANRMYNIHIWHGKESPIDRKGTAVMMAIQLATHMNGKVNLYTEEQGKETDLFIKYFINEDMDGMRYKSHGSSDKDTDFNHFENNEVKTHLFRIDIPPLDVEECGTIAIRRMGLSKKLIKESSKEISWLLVNNKKIYIHLGPKASLENKILIRQLSKEYENYFHASIPISEIYEEKEFTKYVKEKKTKIDRDKDWNVDEDDDTIVNLYKTCIKPNGRLGLEQISEEYPLHYNQLTNTEVYILDCTTDIFVWAPKGISRKKVNAARECAKVFFQEYDRPQWAEIHYFIEGNELPLFKRQFKDWPTPCHLANVNYTRPPLPSNISTTKLIYDFEYINATIKDEVIYPLLDNHPTDVVDVYDITLPELKFYKLDQSEKCNFYQDDCYMVMITTKDRGEKNWYQDYECKTVIYWWEGVNADFKGYASFIHGLYPIIAQKFIDRGQPMPRVERVTQRKEPSHFLKAFDETIVIHKGSRFDDPDITNRIYQFINEGPITYIQELDQNSLVLNSYNIYLIKSVVEQCIYIWKGCNNVMPHDELESFAQRLDEEFKVMLPYAQGDEPAYFWEMLPGLKDNIVMDFDATNDRLFKFYLSSKSQLKILRIGRMVPTDLDTQECCMLDTPESIYLWVGSGCSDTLENICHIFVKDYCKYYSIPQESIKVIRQYEEPLDFKHHLRGWDRKDDYIDPLETRKNQVALSHTLAYRKQCQEEQQLLIEYIEYANSLDDEDDLEDFETWTLIKKGLIDQFVDSPVSPQLNGNNSNGNGNHSNNSNSPSVASNGASSSSGLPPLVGKKQMVAVNSPSSKTPKKKKLFGLFKK